MRHRVKIKALLRRIDKVAAFIRDQGHVIFDQYLAFQEWLNNLSSLKPLERMLNKIQKEVKRQRKAKKQANKAYKWKQSAVYLAY